MISKKSTEIQQQKGHPLDSFPDSVVTVACALVEKCENVLGTFVGIIVAVFPMWTLYKMKL